MNSMEVPFKFFIDETVRLRDQGAELAKRVSDIQAGKANILFYSSIAHEIFPQHRSVISGAKGLAKQRSSAIESGIEQEISNWLKSILTAIASAPTGKRTGEITLKTKRKWMGMLEDATRSTSSRVVIKKANNAIQGILIEVNSLELRWKPRGKLLRSGHLLEGRLEIESLLRSSRGQALTICDPYVSVVTLSIIENSCSGKLVTLITTHIDNTDMFNTSLLKLRENGMQISVVLLERSNRRKPHDRFIVDGSRAWAVGASLKDIGKKDTLISEPDNVEEIRNLLNDYASGKFPPIARY